MAVGISKPHLPWYVPQKYFDKYPLGKIEVPKTLANDLDDVLDRKGSAWKIERTWTQVEKVGLHKEAVRAYLANLSFVDDCSGVVNLIDLYPTLVELCDLPKNPENDGRSFAPLLKNPTQEWNTPTLTDYGFGGHRIYDGRYSYIVFEQNGVEQLYDHQDDPLEWKNLVKDPNYAEVLKRLKALVPAQREPESPRG